MRFEFTKKEYRKEIRVKGKFYCVLGLFNIYNGKGSEWGFIEPNIFERYDDACKYKKILLERLSKDSFYWDKYKIRIWKMF